MTTVNALGQQITLVDETGQSYGLRQDGNILVTMSFEEYAVHKAKAFRFEWHDLLELGDTKEFLIITPVVPMQIHFALKVPQASGETKYQVFNEPTILTTGSEGRKASKNPHWQFIGAAPAATLQVYEDPTYSSVGTEIRDPRWGSGAKQGGSSDPGEYTILSPVQTLLYRLTSFSNDNYLSVEMHWIEWEQEDPEV